MPLSEISAMDAARLAPLISPRANGEDDPRPEPPPGEEEEEAFLPVRTLRTQYIDYLDSKVDEIEEQKESRRYYHSAHYTAEQIRVLRGRHQPPMQPWNRTARKINTIVGLVERLRSDPKPLPNSPKSEQSAEIATHAIRNVLDANEWKSVEFICILQAGIEATAGVQMVLTRGDKGDVDVSLPWVIGDEYFYDPTSYRMDFSDKRYDGLAKWLDVDEAVDLFPDKEEELRGLFQGDSDLTTNPDREIKWVITTKKRIRLIEHWYKHRGRWCWAFYVANTLLDQGVSPFVDDKGKTISPFLMFSAAVDQDGDRYSFVRAMKGMQDALNAGKSKTLHLANTKLIRSEKGAVDNIEIARREAARPDGVIETNPGKTFEVVDTKQDLAAFTAFTEDAKSEFDQYANLNMAALTGAALTNISGRAIELLRQPGMAELGPFILAVRAWKLRVYRSVWSTVQRHWTGERWLRVTNNQGIAQFIQLNGLGADEFGRPAIVNAIGSVDVDIILEEGPDISTVMQDAYDVLKGFPAGTVPLQLLIELNPHISRSEKDRFLKMVEPKPPPPDPLAEAVKRLQVEGIAGQVAQTAAKTRDLHASAEQRLATADEKRAKAATEGVRADHLATSADVAAAEFARDTIVQAHQLSRPQQPPAPAQTPQP